jgi:hypothetical protein
MPISSFRHVEFEAEPKIKTRSKACESVFRSVVEKTTMGNDKRPRFRRNGRRTTCNREENHPDGSVEGSHAEVSWIQKTVPVPSVASLHDEWPEEGYRSRQGVSITALGLRDLVLTPRPD